MSQSIQAVLFDLDGTLLPMDQEVFIKTYFTLISQKLAPLGYEPKALIRAIWKGTDAMLENDGSKSNEDRFWEVFCDIFGKQARKDEPHFEEFYRTDFQKVREVCGFTPAAAETVRALKKKGIRTALATNPIFPAIATRSRMAWAGLSPEDFELYTTYENIGYSKPNLAYYTEITRRLGLSPQDCLMVGNDVGDDMIAEKLGMKVFLLTDHLIDKTGENLEKYPRGDYRDLASYLDSVTL